MLNSKVLTIAGFSVFFLTPTAASRVTTQSKSHGATADSVLSNGLISVTISSVTGLISRFEYPDDGIDLPLTQNWSYFLGATNVSSPQASGAYVFRCVHAFVSRVCEDRKRGRPCTRCLAD